MSLFDRDYKKLLILSIIIADLGISIAKLASLDTIIVWMFIAIGFLLSSISGNKMRIEGKRHFPEISFILIVFSPILLLFNIHLKLVSPFIYIIQPITSMFVGLYYLLRILKT